MKVRILERLLSRNLQILAYCMSAFTDSQTARKKGSSLPPTNPTHTAWAGVSWYMEGMVSLSIIVIASVGGFGERSVALEVLRIRLVEVASAFQILVLPLPLSCSSSAFRDCTLRSFRCFRASSSFRAWFSQNQWYFQRLILQLAIDSSTACGPFPCGFQRFMVGISTHSAESLSAVSLSDQCCSLKSSISSSSPCVVSASSSSSEMTAFQTSPSSLQSGSSPCVISCLSSCMILLAILSTAVLEVRQQGCLMVGLERGGKGSSVLYLLNIMLLGERQRQYKMQTYAYRLQEHQLIPSKNQGRPQNLCISLFPTDFLPNNRIFLID